MWGSSSRFQRAKDHPKRSSYEEMAAKPLKTSKSLTTMAMVARDRTCDRTAAMESPELPRFFTNFDPVWILTFLNSLGRLGVLRWGHPERLDQVEAAYIRRGRPSPRSIHPCSLLPEDFRCHTTIAARWLLLQLHHQSFISNSTKKSKEEEKGRPTSPIASLLF